MQTPKSFRVKVMSMTFGHLRTRRGLQRDWSFFYFLWATDSAYTVNISLLKFLFARGLTKVNMTMTAKASNYLIPGLLKVLKRMMQFHLIRMQSWQKKESFIIYRENKSPKIYFHWSLSTQIYSTPKVLHYFPSPPPKKSSIMKEYKDRKPCRVSDM